MESAVWPPESVREVGVSESACKFRNSGCSHRNRMLKETRVGRLETVAMPSAASLQRRSARAWKSTRGMLLVSRAPGLLLAMAICELTRGFQGQHRSGAVWRIYCLEFTYSSPEVACASFSWASSAAQPPHGSDEVSPLGFGGKEDERDKHTQRGEVDGAEHAVRIRRLLDVPRLVSVGVDREVQGVDTSKQERNEHDRAVERQQDLSDQHHSKNPRVVGSV